MRLTRRLAMRISTVTMAKQRGGCDVSATGGNPLTVPRVAGGAARVCSAGRGAATAGGVSGCAVVERPRGAATARFVPELTEDAVLPFHRGGGVNAPVVSQAARDGDSVASEAVFVRMPSELRSRLPRVDGDGTEMTFMDGGDG